MFTFSTTKLLCIIYPFFSLSRTDDNKIVNEMQSNAHNDLRIANKVQ